MVHASCPWAWPPTWPWQPCAEQLPSLHRMGSLVDRDPPQTREAHAALGLSLHSTTLLRHIMAPLRSSLGLRQDPIRDTRQHGVYVLQDTASDAQHVHAFCILSPFPARL